MYLYYSAVAEVSAYYNQEKLQVQLSNNENYKPPQHLMLPGSTSRVRAPMACSWLIFNKPNISAIYFCAIQFIQSTLHVGVGSKFNYTLICAFFVGICISHLSCLPHEILKQ